MVLKVRELRQALRLEIKTLILQEVRLLRLERGFTPHFVIEAMTHSIQQTKGSIAKLLQKMAHKERTVLLKRLLREAVDKEIDRAIELRKNKCIRCLHGRFHDELGTPYKNLPIGSSRVQSIGCDELQPSVRKSCWRFVEHPMAISFEGYFNEMALIYDFREMIHHIEEIWKDYLTKP